MERIALDNINGNEVSTVRTTQGTYETLVNGSVELKWDHFWSALDGHEMVCKVIAAVKR